MQGKRSAVQKPSHVTTSSEGSCRAEEAAGRSQQRKWLVLMTRLEAEGPLKIYCGGDKADDSQADPETAGVRYESGNRSFTKNVLKTPMTRLEILALSCSCFQTLNL